MLLINTLIWVRGRVLILKTFKMEEGAIHEVYEDMLHT